MHRYLLTILPTPALAAEVLRLRALLHPRIGSFSGRNTPPHITLCFLDLPEAHEQAIINTIAQGATDQHAFMLHYNGIMHFPDKRTIYIDPEEKETIAAVRAPIVAALRDDAALRDALRETDHPHLTIAAGLKPVQFETAWDLLAPHGHQSAERVGEVVLLKRPLQAGTRYAPVRSFSLG